MSIGLFADGAYGDNWGGVAGTAKGLFYGGGLGQLGAQALGVTMCILYVGLSSLIVFWITDKISGARVSAEIELDGLDLPEMGVPGYSGVVLDKASETPTSK